MTSCFAHKENHLKKYQMIIILTLLPLVIYAFYKNGLQLYFKNLVQLVYIIKPLLIIGYAFLLGLLITIIGHKKIKTKEVILYNLLISLCLSININFIAYVVVLLILNILYYFILYKYKIFNYVALSIIIISLGSYFIESYSFLNHYEIIKMNSYNFIDFLLGRSTGGLGTTNILLIIGGLLVLSFQEYYKKDISITAIIIYVICGIWYTFINHSLDASLMLTCNYSVIFAMVYIATINKFSPKLIKERYIYAIIIALLSFIGVFIFEFSLSVFVAILIADLYKNISFLIKNKGK